MSMTRRFVFFARAFLASASKPGAITASTNAPAIFFAVAASTRR